MNVPVLPTPALQYKEIKQCLQNYKKNYFLNALVKLQVNCSGLKFLKCFRRTHDLTKSY